jgi:hypothetical protein
VVSAKSELYAPATAAKVYLCGRWYGSDGKGRSSGGG